MFAYQRMRVLDLVICVRSDVYKINGRMSLVKKSRPPCERICAWITSGIANERGKSCCESKHAFLLFYQLRNGETATCSV